MQIEKRLRELEIIKKEIDDLKEFHRLISSELTTPKNGRNWKTYIKKKVSFSFCGFHIRTKEVEIPINEYVVIDIDIIVGNWIKELERRFEEKLKQ